MPLIHLGDDLKLTVASGLTEFSDTRVALAIGQDAFVYVPIQGLVGLPCFALTLEYDDVAGKRWITSGTFSNQRPTGSVQRYSSPTFSPELPKANAQG